MSRCRRLLLGLYGANVALVVVFAVMGPDRVAIHFTGQGFPDQWASPLVNTMILIGIQTLLLTTFLLSGFLMGRVPARYLNLPNKGYWLLPENKGRASDIIRSWSDELGAGIMFCLLILTGLVWVANRSDPVQLPLNGFWGTLGLLLVFTLVWTVRLLYCLRVPQDNP